MDHRARLARFEQLLSPAVSSSSSSSAADDKASDDEHAVDGVGGVQQHKRNELEGKRKREEVRELCLGGIPDSPARLRTAAYTILLNLPPSSVLTEQYSAFVDEVGRRVASSEQPAVGSKLSKQDKLLREVERDVDRTFGGLSWFGAEPATPYKDGDEEDPFWARLRLLENLDRAKAQNLAASEGASPTSSRPTDDAYLPPSRPLTRRQALLRPLVIYATLNPGLSYVQGMNSLMAVFYRIFASSPTSADADFTAEASAFFALGAVLSQLRDLYVPSMDLEVVSPNATSTTPMPTGLGATLARYSSLLAWLDPTVAACLESKGIDPALYCFRWLTTLFANEFQLPDLVRVWDRIMSLFPAEGDAQTVEALSPVLGHLIDISLAMVLLERPVIVSPYSTFPKIVGRLQDPQIEGEQVDKLLGIAWDIRERRLGRSKRLSMPENGAATWKTAASKWAAAASAAASTASTSTTASSIRSRFWSTPGPASPSSAAAAHDFELDDSASVADSESSVTSAAAGPIFASQGQAIGVSRAAVNGQSPRRPPKLVDGNVTLAELIEAEMPRDTGRGQDDDYYEVDEADEPTLKERAANSWGGWKASLSKLAASDAAAALSKTTTNLQIKARMQAANLQQSTSQSDAAAALSKTTTNLSIQAQMLRDQLAEQGPEKLAKIRETVTGAGGRLVATTRSERGPRRPGSPVEEPFTPPRWSVVGGRDGGQAARAMSPTPDSAGMEKSWSGGGPKPLLLGGSARRASNASEGSATGSKRDSIAWRSPSTSPLMSRQQFPPTSSPDLSVPIGSLARSTSRGSHGRSVSQASASSALKSPDDVPLHSLRIQTHEDSPSANRLRRPIARQVSNSDVAVPAANGRGWQLSDAPVQRTSPPALERPPRFDNQIDADEQPPAFAPTDSAIISDSVRNMFASTEDEMEPVNDDVRGMFAAEDDTTLQAPTRQSSLAEAPVLSAPPRRSSLASSQQEAAADAVVDEDTPLSPQQGVDGSVVPQRSRIVRRPGAVKKRLSSSRASLNGSIDLSLSERRSVSEYLVNGNSGASDGDAVSRRTSRGSKRASLASARHSVAAGWDEDELLDAYGEEEEERTVA